MSEHQHCQAGTASARNDATDLDVSSQAFIGVYSGLAIFVEPILASTTDGGGAFSQQFPVRLRATNGLLTSNASLLISVQLGLQAGRGASYALTWA